jgi:hypothetical protein
MKAPEPAGCRSLTLSLSSLPGEPGSSLSSAPKAADTAAVSWSVLEIDLTSAALLFIHP